MPRLEWQNESNPRLNDVENMEESNYKHWRMMASVNEQYNVGLHSSNLCDVTMLIISIRMQ